MSAIKISADTKFALAAVAANLDPDLQDGDENGTFRTFQKSVGSSFKANAPQWEIGGESSWIVDGAQAKEEGDATKGASNALAGVSDLGSAVTSVTIESLYLKSNILRGEFRAASCEGLSDQYDCQYAPVCDVGHALPGLFTNIESILGAKHKVAIPRAGNMMLGIFDDFDDVDAPNDPDGTGFLGLKNHRAIIGEYCHNLGAGLCGKSLGDIKLAVKGAVHLNPASTASTATSDNSRSENANDAVVSYSARNVQSGGRTGHNENESVVEVGANVSIGEQCDKKGQLLLAINSSASGKVLNYSASYERVLNLASLGCGPAAPKDCNDIIGIKVIRPDHVASGKTSSGSGDDNWSAVEDTDKPLAVQLSYCTNFFGMSIPMYALRMINTIGKDASDGTLHDRANAWFFGIGAEGVIKTKMNGELEGCACPEGGEEEDEE